MPSKTSFFNPTLYKKLLSRFWPMWVGISALASLAPLVTLLELMHITTIRPWYMADIYYAILTAGGPAFMLVYGILAAMAVWGYLYSPRSVSLLHTLPMTRTCLFVTGCAAGLSFLLLPVVIAGSLLLLVGVFFGIAAPLAFLQSGLGLICLAVLFFALATLCAMVTGSLLALPVFYAVVNFLAVLLDLLLANFTGSFFFGVTASYSGAVEWLSPVVYLYHNVGVVYNYTLDTQTSYLENQHLFFLYCLAGLVLLAASWFIYLRRPSESAGDVVSLPILRPLFKIVVALLAAFSFGQVLYLLFTAVRNNGASIVRMGVCMTVAGAVGFWIADMLVQKSLRVWRTTAAGAALMAAVALVVCLAVRFDLFGIENRVPDREDISWITLDVNASGFSSVRFNPGADPAETEQIMAIHRLILDSKDSIRQTCDNYFYYDSRTQDEIFMTYFRLEYLLKNGDRMSRVYTLPITQALLNTPGSYANCLNLFLNSPAVQLRQILYNQGYEPTWGYVEGYRDKFEETGEPFDLSLESSEAARLYAALLEDTKAGRWGQANLLWRRETVSRDSYLHFRLEFRPTETASPLPDDIDGYPQMDRYASFGIDYTPAMTSTRQVLLELGVPAELLEPAPALRGGTETVF